MKHLYYLLSFYLATVALQALAQDCPQALRLARAIYDQGRLQEVETYLQPCFTGKSADGQKALMVEAYKLLCLSHIYLEEPEKADADMLNIKKTDPYYRPNEGVDPAEYVALYKTFREAPIFRFGGRMGLNAARPSVQSVNSAVQLAEGSQYKYGLSFGFGLGFDLPLTPLLTLHAELLYNPWQFSLTEKVIINDPYTGQQRVNEFQGTETQNWINMPAQAEYELFTSSKSISRFSPFVAAGINAGYLLNASITAERQREGQSTVPEANIEISRNKLNAGFVVSAGIKPRLGSGKLVVELRYTYGLTPATTPEKAFANERLLADYYYADPIFKVQALAFSVSYLQEKFSPKKLIKK